MIRSAFFIFTATLLLVACAPLDSAQLAEAAVMEYRQQFNAAKYNEIYSSADPTYRRTISASLHRRKLEHVADAYGQFVSMKRKDMLIRNTGQGTLVTLRYLATYKEGLAGEIFVFRIDLVSRRARLLGYELI